MNKRYSADKVKIEKLRSKKIFEIVVVVATALVSLYGMYMLATLDDFSEFDRYFRADEVRNHAIVALLCTAGGIGVFGGTLLQLWLDRLRLNNMLQSYIQLNENGVQGMSLINPYYIKGGTPFTVPYSSIRNIIVQTDWKATGLNLTIESDLGTFKCLEIEQPFEVANEIRQMIKAQQEAKQNT